MNERMLIDTGPIVAFLKRDDADHRMCVNLIRDRTAPFFTCWPVITEAAWLLRGRKPAIQRLLTAIHTGLFEILELDVNASLWLRTFIDRYWELGVQLADASLVYLAERERIDTVFTLDRRDFSVYRIDGNRPIRLFPETT